MAWRSAIPANFFIKRVWLALPFFTGMIILPALFIIPGPALVHLPLGLTITQTGATSALFLLLRVSTSVSLTLLLVLTTSWNGVLSALSVLKVPDVFILILGMTYRYIYLLLHTANDMFLSRKSRTVGRLNGSEDRRMIAAISGTLLSKSLNMSSEVYLAMVSRGFRGTMVTLKPFRMQRRDWLWLGIFTIDYYFRGHSGPLITRLKSMNNEPVFEVDHVSFAYDGKQTALDNVSLTVEAGESLVILGANGSGKSTLLKLLDGLYFPSQGSICAFGQPLSEDGLRDDAANFAFRRRVGLVFQDTDVQLFSPFGDG